MGPTATARNIGRCGSTGAECLAAITTTLFTPLVYTNSVKVASATAYRNNTKAEATSFLLPQLPDYFPANDILGMCTAITLSLPTVTSALRRRDDVATVGGDGVTTWPGCETLTDANAKRGLAARQSVSSTTLPICSLDKELSTTTVTETLRDTGKTTAAQPLPSLAATRKRMQYVRVVCYLFLMIVLMGRI